MAQNRVSLNSSEADLAAAISVRGMKALKVAALTISGIAALWLTLWLYTGREQFCQQHPHFAWRYGTAKMQGFAAKQLAGQIAGMSYEEVSALLGPGSAHWPPPRDPGRNSPDDFAFSYNVHAEYNNGLDVYFVSNKVARVFYYD
jgi:hypothetical protein